MTSRPSLTQSVKDSTSAGGAKGKTESDWNTYKGPDPLLTRPRNRTTKRIFVAATRMNEGKTTSCLGLFAALRSRSPNVGFIKPVGQRFINVEGHTIDEDSFLLDSIFNVRVPIDAMSPIAIDSQFTRDYLRDPDAHYPVLVDRLCRAFDRAAYEKEFIIIEGSGHAGVGSVFDLSNAQTARLLGAKVIIVSQGGIGRPVDEIALNKALFEKHGVEVIGAIINKVVPSKMEEIRPSVKVGLERYGVPLLGMIPLQQALTAPNLSQIVEEIRGTWLNGRESGPTNRIQKVVIGAMTAKGLMDFLQPGVLVITPGDREDIIMSAIASAGYGANQRVSGIILTRNIMPPENLVALLKQTDIPVILSDKESFTVASRINTMTVKTQPTDSDKIPVIKKLIQEHIQIGKIIDAFEPDVSQMNLIP